MWIASRASFRRQTSHWRANDGRSDRAGTRDLKRNDRDGCTVPTDRLYPFQWNWYSAFVALGWATFDEARAFTEIDRLLEGQWDDGMVPQIVFHAEPVITFPALPCGAHSTRRRHRALPQPPVLASVIRRLLDRARDRATAEVRTAAIYPKLLGSHRWLARARDPAKSGLVSVLHPWVLFGAAVASLSVPNIGPRYGFLAF